MFINGSWRTTSLLKNDWPIQAAQEAPDARPPSKKPPLYKGRMGGVEHHDRSSTSPHSSLQRRGSRWTFSAACYCSLPLMVVR